MLDNWSSGEADLAILNRQMSQGSKSCDKYLKKVVGSYVRQTNETIEDMGRGNQYTGRGGERGWETLTLPRPQTSSPTIQRSVSSLDRRFVPVSTQLALVFWYNTIAIMTIEKMAMLPSLRRQNLLAELCVNIKYSSQVPRHACHS